MNFSTLFACIFVLAKALVSIEEADLFGNESMSLHDAGLLENYLKSELNYTARVIVNSLGDKMYWYKVAKRMQRAANVQKESKLQSSRLKLFMGDLSKLQIAVLKLKQKRLDARITSLTVIYTGLSGKDTSDLPEDKIALGILADAAECRANVRSNMTLLARRRDQLEQEIVNATSNMEREPLLITQQELARKARRLTAELHDCSERFAEIRALRHMLGNLQQQYERLVLLNPDNAPAMLDPDGSFPVANTSEAVVKRAIAILRSHMQRVAHQLMIRLEHMPEGMPCERNLDCSVGQTCENGRCSQVMVSSKCARADECGNGQLCLLSRCLHIVDGSPCNLDEECGNGQLCFNNGCSSIFGTKRRQYGLQGTTCDNNLDCAALHTCHNRVCTLHFDTATCRDTGECANGQFCSSHQCISTPLGVACQTSVDCASGEKCLDGRCRALYGKRPLFVNMPMRMKTTCQDRYDCEGRQICKEHTCVPTSLFTECKNTAECGNGLICKKHFCENEPKGFLHNVTLAPSCNRTKDCAAGRICIHNGCRAAFGFTTGHNLLPGRDCQHDVDCGIGQRCSGKKCVQAPQMGCMHKDECGNGQQCVGARCEVVLDGADCQELNAAGESVSVDARCGKLQTCGLKCNSYFGVDEQSFVPAGTPCLSTKTCGSFQVCTRNVCASVPRLSPCTSSAQCGIRGICLATPGEHVSMCHTARDHWWCANDEQCGFAQVCAKSRCVSLIDSEYCDDSGGLPFIISPQPAICMQTLTDAGDYKRFAAENPVVMSYMENPKDFDAAKAMTELCHERNLRLSDRTATPQSSEPSFLQLQQTTPDAPLPTAWLSSTHAIHFDTDNVGVLSIEGISRGRNKFFAVQADDDEIFLPTVMLTEHIGSVLQLGASQRLVYTAPTTSAGNTKPVLSVFLLFKTQFSEERDAEGRLGSCVASVFLASSSAPHLSVCTGPTDIRVYIDSQQFALKTRSRVLGEWVLMSVTTTHESSGHAPEIFLYTESSAWKETKPLLKPVGPHTRLPRAGIGITFDNSLPKSAPKCFGSLCATAVQLAENEPNSLDNGSSPVSDEIASIMVGGCPVTECAERKTTPPVLVHDVVLFEEVLSPAQRQRISATLVRDLARLYQSNANHNTRQQLLWERDAITNILSKGNTITGKNTSDDKSLLGDMTLPDLSDLLTVAINEMDNGTMPRSKTAIASSSRFAEIQPSDTNKTNATDTGAKRATAVSQEIEETLACMCNLSPLSNSPRSKSCVSLAEKGMSCSRDNLCGPRMNCRDGFCALRPDMIHCNDTAHCSNGQRCMTGSCIFLPEGLTCNRTLECGHGQVCLVQRCTALYGSQDLARKLDALLQSLRARLTDLQAWYAQKRAEINSYYKNLIDQLRSEFDQLKSRLDASRRAQAAADAKELEALTQKGEELKRLLGELKSERADLRDSKKHNDDEALEKATKAIEALNAEKSANAAIQADMLKLDALSNAKSQEEDKHLWRLAKQRGDRRGYKIENGQAIFVGGKVFFPNGPAASAFDSNHKMRGTIANQKKQIEDKRREWEAAIVRLVRPKSCNQLLGLATGGQSGTYTVFPPTYALGASMKKFYGGISTYCDMTTDGGGWSLLAYASEGKLQGPLTVTHGKFKPLQRNGTSNINSLWIAQSSREMAISWSLDYEARSNRLPVADITSYQFAIKFDIPNPESQTLAPSLGSSKCGDATYAPVKVSCLAPSKNCGFPDVMFTGTRSLGACFGHAYGVAFRPGGYRATCDWTLDNITPKGSSAVYVSLDDTAGCGGILVDDTQVQPLTVAIWVR